VRGLYFRKTGSLDHLRVEELPLPVPKAGEVVVKVLAAAVNPSDTKNILGKMAEVRPPNGKASRFSALEGILVLDGMAATLNLCPFRLRVWWNCLRS
jgi:NADPH:quinone reductase-like Zn-dependent oxidoreductase